MNPSDYIIGPMRVSHDNGETWHLGGESCEVCADGDRRTGPTAIVTSIDRERGVITVTATGTRGDK